MSTSHQAVESRMAASVFTAVLVLVGALVAGCGSSSNGVDSNAGAHRLAGIKYAHCMRAHGVDVLDPDQNGNIQINAPNTPKAIVDRANQACRKLRTAAVGTGMTAAQHARAVKQMTDYARCMRAHHVPMAGVVLTARVTSVDPLPASGESGGEYPVHFALEGSDSALRAGMSAEVTITLGR
jgi:hypothetical protein